MSSSSGQPSVTTKNSSSSSSSTSSSLLSTMIEEEENMIQQCLLHLSALIKGYKNFIKPKDNEATVRNKPERLPSLNDFWNSTQIDNVRLENKGAGTDEREDDNTKSFLLKTLPEFTQILARNSINVDERIKNNTDNLASNSYLIVSTQHIYPSSSIHLLIRYYSDIFMQELLWYIPKNDFSNALFTKRSLQSTTTKILNNNKYYTSLWNLFSDFFYVLASPRAVLATPVNIYTKVPTTLVTLSDSTTKTPFAALKNNKGFLEITSSDDETKTINSSTTIAYLNYKPFFDPYLCSYCYHLSAKIENQSVSSSIEKLDPSWMAFGQEITVESSKIQQKPYFEAIQSSSSSSSSSTTKNLFVLPTLFLSNSFTNFKSVMYKVYGSNPSPSSVDFGLSRVIANHIRNKSVLDIDHNEQSWISIHRNIITSKYFEYARTNNIEKRFTTTTTTNVQSSLVFSEFYLQELKRNLLHYLSVQKIISSTAILQRNQGMDMFIQYLSESIKTWLNNDKNKDHRMVEVQTVREKIENTKDKNLKQVLLLNSSKYSVSINFEVFKNDSTLKDYYSKNLDFFTDKGKVLKYIQPGTIIGQLHGIIQVVEDIQNYKIQEKDIIIKLPESDTKLVQKKDGSREISIQPSSSSLSAPSKPSTSKHSRYLVLNSYHFGNWANALPHYLQVKVSRNQYLLNKREELANVNSSNNNNNALRDPFDNLFIKEKAHQRPNVMVLPVFNNDPNIPLNDQCLVFLVTTQPVLDGEDLAIDWTFGQQLKQASAVEGENNNNPSFEHYVMFNQKEKHKIEEEALTFKQITQVLLDYQVQVRERLKRTAFNRSDYSKIERDIAFPNYSGPSTTDVKCEYTLTKNQSLEILAGIEETNSSVLDVVETVLKKLNESKNDESIQVQTPSIPDTILYM
jgi:hypothetical protein